MNVYVRHCSDLSADVIAARMVHAGFDVRVLVSSGLLDRNAIIMGGAVASLHKPKLLMSPEVLQDEIIAELQRMQFRDDNRSWRSQPADESDCSEQTA
jgi:hypothetical protein